MRRLIILSFALLVPPLGASPAHADASAGIVVATCGTPPAGYTAGQSRQITQNTSGQLCGAATSTPSGTQDVNIVQTGGVTQLRGAGAVGTGSERVAVGQDTTTIAGSAPGTAGTPSANVVTVQGATSMTPVLTNPSPSSSSAVAIAPSASTATESGHAAICAAACNTYGLWASNLSTTTTLYFMVFNSTTVPGDGAVTPLYCIPIGASGFGGVSAGGGPPPRFSTGVSVALSSGVSCTTKTASVNGFFTWSVQ